MILAIVVTLAGCARDEPPADDTSRPVGIDREDFDRLYADRYCAEWEVCSTGGGACPLPLGTSPYPPGCDFDGVSAQACIVGEWSCQLGYPSPPASCNRVCASSSTLVTY